MSSLGVKITGWREGERGRQWEISKISNGKEKKEKNLQPESRGKIGAGDTEKLSLSRFNLFLSRSAIIQVGSKSVCFKIKGVKGMGGGLLRGKGKG